MVLVIAEIGINHNGNLALAHEMIRQAAASGADVAKFQLYSVDALFGVNGEDPRPDMVDMLYPIELGKSQVHQLHEWCQEESIEFMASVFDEERLGWVEELGVRRHKIASRTSKFTPVLAKKIASTGKECFMSLGLGASKLTEDFDNVRYLYCVSEYPTEFKNIKIPMSFAHDTWYGFSDHSLGIEAALVAVSRGARVIEKHFTLNKAAQGPDHVCSIDPSELKDLVKYAKSISKVVTA